MISFFVFCESIFRKCFASSDNHSLQIYIDFVCNRSDIVSIFYTYFHDVVVKSQKIQGFAQSTSFDFFEMSC